MYRERGWCRRCGTTIYREEWKRAKLPENKVWWRGDPLEIVPTRIEIEIFYKYFDEQGNEVVVCPKCKSIWI